MFYSTKVPLLAASASASHAHAPAVAAQLDQVMLLGFLSAFVTLFCLPHVRQCRATKLLLSISLGAQATYGFLTGAWPLGLVAFVASSMAARWWWRDSPIYPQPKNASHAEVSRRCLPAVSESRVSGLFGPNKNTDRSVNDN